MMTVLWVAVPCRLHREGDDRPNDGGCKHFWNVGKFLPDYTAQ
jgi:hypothetical protein